MSIKKLCPKCGHTITPLDKTCPSCGAKFRWGISATTKPSATGVGQQPRKMVISKAAVHSVSLSPIMPLHSSGSRLESESEVDKASTQPISLPEIPSSSNRPADATSISNESIGDSEGGFPSAPAQEDVPSPAAPFTSPVFESFTDPFIPPKLESLTDPFSSPELEPFTDEDLEKAIAEESQNLGNFQKESEPTYSWDPKLIPRRLFFKIFVYYCWVKIGIVILFSVILAIASAKNIIPSWFMRFDGWWYWIGVLAWCFKIWTDAQYAASVHSTIDYNARIMNSIRPKYSERNWKLDNAGICSQCFGAVVGIVMLGGMILALCHAEWGFALGFFIGGGCLFMDCWVKGSIICAQSWNEEVAHLLNEKVDFKG